MPHLTISRKARSGIYRCRTFLLSDNPRAADAASQRIKRALASLQTSPEIGRMISETPELRELVISHGSSGYLALYKYDRADNAVLVLAFRHQREVDY